MLGAVVTYPSTTLNERNVSYDLGKTLPNQFLSLSLSLPSSRSCFFESAAIDGNWKIEEFDWVWQRLARNVRNVV